MNRIFRSLVLSALLALPVWPAAAQTPPAEEAEQETPPADDSATEAEQEAAPEVLETDDESYLDIDDEDFTPSEEIPADQSVTFPTDI